MSKQTTRPAMRLSYSTLSMVHSCPRKYQGLKLTDMVSMLDITMDSSKNRDALDFGKAFGIGAQHYFVTGDKDAALVEALKAYNFVETEIKNIGSLVLAIDSLYIPKGWQVYTITNRHGIQRPATEVGFKIVLNKDTGDYYCGYIDLIMESPADNAIFPLDFKHSALAQEDLTPLYLNSDQVTGYASIMSHILPDRTSHDIVYDVTQFRGSPIPIRHIFPYTKTPVDRLDWLISLQLDYEQLLRYHELEVFPKRGSACFGYNRACPLFKVCDLPTIQEQLYQAPVKEEYDWDYVLDLEDLIDSAMKAVDNFDPTEVQEHFINCAQSPNYIEEITL